MGPLARLRRHLTAPTSPALGTKDADIPLPRPMADWWWNFRVPSQLDLDRVGNGLDNSAVSLVVDSLARALAEPPLRAFRRVEGEDEEVDHPATVLWDDPNPYMHPGALLHFAVTQIVGWGSAFVYKVRDGVGPMELWPLPAHLVEPYTAPEAPAGVLQTAWRYRPGSVPVDLPLEDVIHLRWKIDPTDMRRGLSPIKPVLKEILGDEEAASFTAGLMQNLGVPGVILSPKDPADPGPSPEEAEVMEETWMRKFGGGGRGRPYIPTGGLVPHVVSFSPSEMDLRALRRIPEERISGALGWPAILAGLGAGLDRATYANARTLREFATEQTLIPLWAVMSSQLDRQLGGEWPVDATLRFDTSEVRALQQDETDLVNRMNTALQGGWATVAEARRAIGLDVEDHHDVFLRGVNELEVENLPEEQRADTGDDAIREGQQRFLEGARPEEALLGRD